MNEVILSNMEVRDPSRLQVAKNLDGQENEESDDSLATDESDDEPRITDLLLSMNTPDDNLIIDNK